ncbi:hypothetical protein D9M68_18690 [compost metagenome]
MYTIKQTRMLENVAALIKAGVEKFTAMLIAKKLAAQVILDIAISDKGIHINLWDNMDFSEKKFVFNFVA